MATQPVIGMDRDAINALGSALQSLRLEGEDIVTCIGAHRPSVDCRNGHVSVVVRRGEDSGLGEAVSLDDAIRLARGVLNETAKKRADEAAKARAESVA